MNIVTQDFTPYEVKKISVLFPDDQTASSFGCAGSMEVSHNTKIRKKTCGGKTLGSRVSPDGTGSIKLNIFANRNLLIKAFSMMDENLAEGVRGYGKNLHTSFCLVALVVDFDDIEKYVAFPRCIFEDGFSEKVDNSSDEQTPAEINLAINQDEYGFTMYDAIVSEITDENIKSQWMTKFTPDLVKKAGSAA